MKLKQVFSEVFGIPQDSVVDDLELKSIPAWDSMTHMVLISRLEETFSVMLTGDEIADMSTVGDARRFLSEHGASL